MHSRLIAALVVAGLLAACREEETPAPPRADRASAATADTATIAHHTDSAAVADTADPHAGHTMPAAADPHAEHTTTAAGAAHTAHAEDGGRATGAHAAHDAGGRSPRNDHAGHASQGGAARGAAGGHAAHATQTTRDGRAGGAADAHAQHGRAPTAHAQHTTRDTSAHAQHTMPDSAAHAQHATRDTASHAGHAARDTTAHAHAQPAGDSAAHAQHGAAKRDAHAGHDSAPADTPAVAHGGAHRMWMRPLGGGWHIVGMAQVLPIYTWTQNDGGGPLAERGAYLTQPAVMFNLESRGARVALRSTLNFEGLTQPDGEVTWGGWGEGFLDSRHPHTLLHEAMLSLNFPDFAGGAASISAGKGFAPYGTDDPMSRAPIKYPTNHHLSQVLERWTVNGVYLRGGVSAEVGVFGGSEPTGPYDFSNIESFADSWSARGAVRFGAGTGPLAANELSASYASIREEHHGVAERTALYNAAFRHQHAHGFGSVYYLVEASRSRPEHDDGYYSLLGEAQLGLGRHMPYARFEYATRPEYEREGAPGTDEFFRYHHDGSAIGATRWRILTLGYDFRASGYPVDVRPTVAVQYHSVSPERGGIDPLDLFGRSSFWSATAGFRLFFGGTPMRMGAYGVLDAMTAMHQAGMHADADAPPSHGGH